MPELVQIRTQDGLRLDGALHTAPGVEPRGACDALITIHGTLSNFYGSSVFAGLIPKLLADVPAVLAINTRGHDAVSIAATVRGPQRCGSAYERLDDCRLDLAAWCDYLVAAGYTRIGLLGHSLGALKALHAMCHEPRRDVARVVAISPPRLSHALFSSSVRDDEFLDALHQAEAAIAAGRPNELLDATFPLAQLVSAASYMEKYGPDSPYDVFNYIQQLRVPTLFTFGGLEVASEIPFQGLPDEIEKRAAARADGPSIRVSTVADANHVYVGQIDPLAYLVRAFLASRD